MSDVIYTHLLPLKEFPVSYTGLKTWLESTSAYCCGYSVDYAVKVHFTTGSDETVNLALDNYWSTVTDDGSAAAEAAKNRALMIEETKINYGIKVRAFLGYQCELNLFTPVQYAAMLADLELAFCSTLLISGALESCKEIIDAYTPTEYFTNDMKTAMSAEIAKYIALVSAL